MLIRMRWWASPLAAGLLVLGAWPGALVGQAAPATPCLVPDSALAKRGESVFTMKGCNACHTIGGGKRAGPDLAGVTHQRELGWLRRWLKNPTDMLDTDSTAKALLAEYFNVPMPNLRLNDEEVEALLHYMARESTKASRAGTEGKCTG